jgi:molybdopterin-containing oxidoreductase family iron-sulfur binding subunit
MTIPPLRNVGDKLAGALGKLTSKQGPRFWRSLEELAETPEFLEYLHREFPSQASEWLDTTSRRQFLRLMGASLALAGVSGCAYNAPETIVPYVRMPEELVPGRPLFYASAVPLGGYAHGILVETHEGRPTKIEGNPDHPATLGASDPFLQASILSLYDPDRSQVVGHNGRISTWDDFLTVLIDEREKLLVEKGAGLRILTETITSPALAQQIKDLLTALPQARWHQHDPVGRGNTRAGAELAFGEIVEPVHHFEKASVILALDADFLGWGPAKLREARRFSAHREPGQGETAINRLYVAEPCPTITGAMADAHLPVRAHEVYSLALAVARAVGVEGVQAADTGLPTHEKWVTAVAADLKAHPGASLVVAGETQPREVHALTHALNQTLGNASKTVEYIPPIEIVAGDETNSLRALARDMTAGLVDTLVILGGNPAYDAPADLDFARSLAKVRLSIRLGLYEDETSSGCHWHVPEAHVLESWGESRAFDGTTTIQQPLIAALYGGKTSYELLAVLLGQPGRSGLDVLREYWKKHAPDGDFETFWRTALHNGLIADSAAKPKAVSLKLPSQLPPPPMPGAGELELIFRPDPTVWDGRFANNGWLQELPKPLTKLTWDNAALLSKATADRLGLSNEEMVELNYHGRKLFMPVWLAPGHADDSVTIHLGYGRTRAGRVGSHLGFSAYALRTSDAPWFGAGLGLHETGQRYPLATTQHHFNMEGRNLVRLGPNGPTEEEKEHIARDKTLFEVPEPQRLREVDKEGNSWGMVINLNTCIGCNACVAACQAENNIPIVGKEQVLANREMHWIRIDRYYDGSEANPKSFHQPVLCMHCEKAPCELVCPVAATSHSAEGLNEMTYNRCVGTRYCSNNCPYKVRRFNFLQYSDEQTPSLKLLYNPNVTVRPRGVMEKCTYCVQRINAARIAAAEEGGRRVGGNEVVTACQAACPTRAIVFGNLNDAAADVAKLKESPRNYSLLAELNTRPRTSYLTKLTNPNPGLEQE